MKVLLQQASVIRPGESPEKADLLIEDGIISSIGSIDPQPDHTVISSPNLHVSIGWFDLHANFRDPGYEDKETLTSGLNAAARGGFTGVAVMPSTSPPIDSKSGIDYLRHASASHAVELVPVGTVTRGLKGKDLSEMFDMHQNGARAFSDDKQAISDPNLMQRALLYAKGFDGLVMHFPFDERLAPDGKMNEGETSTAMGLKGIPALAEELALARDLYLLEYTQGRLHVQTVSAKGSVDLIRAAKAKGLRVTAEVSAHHLTETEEAVTEFDTNYKLMPPLRSKADREALLAGLQDGTIDAICSDHQPEIPENKRCEFDHAAFGMASIETVFPVINRTQQDTEDLVKPLAYKPRKILGLEIPTIAVGEAANLTVFDPDLDWTYDHKQGASKGINSPYHGQQFTGKVLAIARNNQWIIH